MPRTTVDAVRRVPTPAVPAELEEAANLRADMIARMVDTAAQVRADVPDGRVGALSLFIADACLLARSTCGVVGPAELSDLVGRLWMVGGCLSAQAGAS